MDLRSTVGVIDVAPAEDGHEVDTLTSSTDVISNNGTLSEIASQQASLAEAKEDGA